MQSNEEVNLSLIVLNEVEEKPFIQVKGARHENKLLFDRSTTGYRIALRLQVWGKGRSTSD
jgi:hypothetical protein